MITSAVAAMSDRVGRYEIIAPLGGGGMAAIFLAKLRGPEGFERAVVIKRMRGELVTDREFVDMFLDEARLIASIRHPNVVQVQELGHEEGDLFLAMEYLHGESVLSIVRRLLETGRRIPPLLAAYIVSEAAAGLHAAHELVDAKGVRRGVVHRDLSPDNLFVTYDGDVKVIDFGIAKATARRTKTMVGTVKGKLSYMSPEQICGQPIDHRSDIFALGIVLWELLAGRRLFKRPDDDGTTDAVLAAEVPDIPEADPALLAVCARALAREPSDRYLSAGDLRRDLASIFLRAGLSELPQDTLASLMQASFRKEIRARTALLSKASVEAQVRALPSVMDLASLPPVEAIEPTTQVDLRAPVLDPTPPTPVRVKASGSSAGPTLRVDAGSSAARSAPDKVRAPQARPRPGERTELVDPGALVPRTRRRALGWAATLAFAAVAVTASVWLLRRGADPVEARPLAPAPPPPAATAPRVPAPAAPHVVVSVTSTPPGAALTIDGEGRGVTPTELEVQRSAAPLAITLSLDGYAPRTIRIVPDRNRELDLQLSPAPRPAAPKARPAKKRQGFFQFD